VLGIHAANGGFHLKAAGVLGERDYFAAKTNANFSDNPRRFGLPAIQGAVLLADASNGSLLALMDSGSVTALRTGAATAVAAKYLSRRNARTATIVGCGVQGEIQLESIAVVLRLSTVRLYDIDQARATDLARRASARLGMHVDVVTDLSRALRESDVCVTCTPSRRAFVTASDIAAGTFVAAVGADNPTKQEIEADLLASATLVVDILEQCAEIGELHHALAAGVMSRTEVHAELGDVVSGRKPGRTSDDEITVFDSSGTALQDVAAAVTVYEKALARGRGTEVKLDA
jgi:ornithine cyclodeaminase/alanine dehydrogenase-like protein (mu-crystallin family)